MKNLHDQTIALAAIYQAIQTVDKLARRGSASEHDIQTCIESLFVFDSPTTEAIYGSIVDLKTGLTGLVKQLNGKALSVEPELTTQPELSAKALQQQNIAMAQYVIGVMFLHKKLCKNNTLLESITARLEAAKNQAEHFGTTLHENVLANISDIFSESVSPLGAKIMVQGEQIHLSNPLIVNKIRSLLLAAVRAAILWNQLGGRRWHILFKRNKILKMAESILEREIPQYIN